MSHCREKEWDGAGCGLQYSASLSEASPFFTLLRISSTGSRRDEPQESEALQPGERSPFQTWDWTVLRPPAPNIRLTIHPNLSKSPETWQLLQPRRCASLPVPSLIYSEGGEERPIYYICLAQWHIVTRNHWEQSPLSKYRGHSAVFGYETMQ